MLTFNASAFYTAASGLRHAQVVTKNWSDQERRAPIGESNRASSSAALEELIAALKVLNTRVTCMAAERLLEKLRGTKLTYSEYADAFKHIDSVLRDELSLSNV